MKGEVHLTIGRARRVWVALGSMTTLDRSTVTRPAMMTLARRRWLDEQAVDDREARFAAVRDRTKPTGPMPGPTNMDALDARALIDQVVTGYAPEVFRAATALPLLSAAASSYERVREGLDVLANYAPGLAGNAFALPMVLDLLEALGGVLRAGERVAGLDTLDGAVGRPCPVCDLRSLRYRYESPWPGEWVVECRDRACVCPAVVGCPCGRHIRVPGRRHYWARDEWEALAVPELRVAAPAPA